jgi:uncharacterized oxidoreductase
VTGGASGIGLALAVRFLEAGSQVIICGRREEKLQEAKQQYPQLETRVCDVAQESERIALFKWVQETHPELNGLVNNAGIQRRVSFIDNQEEWSSHQQEIAINFEAPVHLCALFIPFLRQQEEAVIINVTSGLAFAPAAFAPVYSATKAALHSFTLSLRHQLAKTSIQVLEIAPPAVQTDLGGPGLHTFGASLNDFADSVVNDLKNGSIEVGYGTSEKARKASREELDALFQQINNR